MQDDAQSVWEAYRDRERAAVTSLLSELGFALETVQPHIAGERYLMQAVTTVSGPKLILLARRRSDGARVVIKATSDPAGKRELLHERRCRQVLHRIKFAYGVFHSPPEILFVERAGFLISAQAFIEQESQFLARPLREQFSLALAAFKAQEGAHATTYGHERLIRATFGMMRADEYLRAFDAFWTKAYAGAPDLVPRELFAEAARLLAADRETIEQYCGFLTHTDLVPHNIRVAHGVLYLLDHSSLRFGNKYEGWARFLNFMTLYNPPLTAALSEYVRMNRTPEESLSLKLMRVYRLGEIVWYYVSTLSRCSGNLHALNRERVRFWSEVLAALLHGLPMPPRALARYSERRDALRSDDEKLRQEDLH